MSDNNDNNNNNDIEEAKAMARRTIEYAQIFRAINLCGARVFQYVSTENGLETNRIPMCFGMFFIGQAALGKTTTVDNVEDEYVGDEAENIINELKAKLKKQVDDEFDLMVLGSGNEKKINLERKQAHDSIKMFSSSLSGATEKRVYQEAQAIKKLQRGSIYCIFNEVRQLLSQGLNGVQGNFFYKLLDYLDGKITTNSTGEKDEDGSRPQIKHVPFVLIMTSTFDVFDDKMKKALYGEMESGLTRRMYIIKVPDHDVPPMKFDYDNPFPVGRSKKNPHIQRLMKIRQMGFDGLGNYYIDVEAQRAINAYRNECLIKATKVKNKIVKQELINSFFKVMKLGSALHIFYEPEENKISEKWIKEAIKYEQWYQKHSFNFAQELLDIKTGSEKFVEWFKECDFGKLNLVDVRKKAELIMGIKNTNFAKEFVAFLELNGLDNSINEHGFYIVYEKRNCTKYRGQMI